MSDYNDIDREFAEVEASFFKEARIPAVGNIKRDTCKEDENGKKPRNPENCKVWTKKEVDTAYEEWKNRDVKNIKYWKLFEGAKTNKGGLSPAKINKNIEEYDLEDFKDRDIANDKGVNKRNLSLTRKSLGDGSAKTTSRKTTKEKKKRKRKEEGKPTRRKNVKKTRRENLRKRKEHLIEKNKRTMAELGKTASDHLLYSQNSRFAGHDDDHRGSYMSAQNISEMAFFIKTLFEQVQDGRELPDWVEDKISHAHSDLEDLHSYFSFGHGFDSQYADWEGEDEGFELISKVAHRGTWQTSLYSVDGNAPETGIQILRDNGNDPEIEEILIEVFETGVPYEGFNMASVSLIKKASFEDDDFEDDDFDDDDFDDDDFDDDFEDFDY